MGDLTLAGSIDDRPASPCTGICTLDDDDRCVGCGRTLDDIAAWGSMTGAEQRAVIAGLYPP
ncbi:DUF1289 domain-containing protein [Sphingomonas bacterium]|uniref:DUF1289 domain-containing protein n=1 Tax=Sphingomonas bacterium TaxID=1895847 RepID=UPI0015769C77|nr:DUF1289 domain-containing protein [Sphingomonas bacterium]